MDTNKDTNRNYSNDFEPITPWRRGTGSYKWDSSTDSEVIPMWVADMDFRTAPCIVKALETRVAHGVFGYTLVGEDYYDALIDWFSSRHQYNISRNNVIYTSGVVPAISAIIKGLTEPGEGIIVQTPVYNCFFSSIRNNGCRVVENPLIRVDLPDGTFSFRMDYDDLEKKAADPGTTMLLLCNPHNPAGRCWEREELLKMGEICRRNGIRVVSDEIHCELTRPGLRYTPYGVIDSELARADSQTPQAIVCLSPSKAFNTAGLQIANIVCPDSLVRAAVDRAININEVCDVNPFGVVALKAAYTEEGEEWLTGLRKYLWHNYIFMVEYLADHLPECPVTLLEATYLPMIDVSALNIPSDELEHLLREQAKVWFNSGDMYGTGGYLRVNIACRRDMLEEGLMRFVRWVKER